MLQTENTNHLLKVTAAIREVHASYSQTMSSCKPDQFNPPVG